LQVCSDVHGAGLEHYDCVLRSAESVFRQLCSLEVAPCDDPGDLTESGAMLAIISLGCNEFDWSVVLGVPCETAVAVASRFAGFDIPFDSDDMGDAMGEMANIFAGLIQKELASHNLTVEISLPSIMRGQNLSVMGQSDEERATFFDSDVGKIWCSVMAHSEEKRHAAEKAQAPEPPQAAAPAPAPTPAQQDNSQEMINLIMQNRRLRAELAELKQAQSAQPPAEAADGAQEMVDLMMQLRQLKAENADLKAALSQAPTADGGDVTEQTVKIDELETSNAVLKQTVLDLAMENTRRRS